MDWALQTTWSYHWTGHNSNTWSALGWVPWTTTVRQLNWRIHSAMLGFLVHSFMLLIFICVLPFILAKVPDSFIPFHVLISYDLINSFYVSVDFSCIALFKICLTSIILQLWIKRYMETFWSKASDAIIVCGFRQ